MLCSTRDCTGSKGWTALRVAEAGGWEARRGGGSTKPKHKIKKCDSRNPTRLGTNSTYVPAAPTTSFAGDFSTQIGGRRPLHFRPPAALLPAPPTPRSPHRHRAALICASGPIAANAGSTERKSSGAEESSAQVMTMSSLGVHNDVLGESPRKRSRGKSG